MPATIRVVDSRTVISVGENTALATAKAAEAVAAAASFKERSELYFYDRCVWDVESLTLSLPRSAWHKPTTQTLTINLPPATWYTMTFPATGAQALFFDQTVASGTNPFSIRPHTTAQPFSDTKLMVALVWNGQLIPTLLGDVQYTNRIDARVQQLASNLPVVFIPAGDTAWGVVPGSYGTWMVPKTVRYLYRANTITSVNNAASTAIDPTGTYDWSLYVELPINHIAESTLYLNPGARTVGEKAQIDGPIRGTISGFVPLAVYHTGTGKPLKSMSGIKVMRAGQDPDQLFARMASAEASLSSAGAAGVQRSSGESLSRALTKLATIRAGGSAVLRIAAGPADSWWDRTYSGAELLARFAADGVAMSSSGYISFSEGESSTQQANGVVCRQADGVTFLGAGAAAWAIEDGSEVSAPSYLSGSGNAISTTAADRTLKASGIKAATVDLVYQDLTGTFRFRVNGGAWTAVTGANTGNAVRLRIASGLSGAANVIDIDTTGNAGTVRLLDLYADGGATGVQFNKLGNGSSMADDWVNWIDAYTRELVAMNADMAIVGLGVNDQKNGRTATAFAANMATMLDAIYAAVPDLSVILLVPPRTGGEDNVGAESMQAFGEQYASLYASYAAAGRSIEIVRLDRLWADFATESGLGVFAADGLHINNDLAGAYRRYVGSFYDPMLRRYLAA